MTDPHQPDDDTPRPSGASRRVTRRRFTQMAAGLVAGVAGLVSRSEAAGANGTIHKVGCCKLKHASDSGCAASCQRIGEKTSYRMRVWNCVFTRTITYACWECCYGGSSCWNATHYYCSYAQRFD